MITDRQTFEYQGRVLISRARIKAPYRMEAFFEDQGCFLYFKGPGFKLLSADKQDAPVNGKEAVLLRCGTYFFDLLSSIESESVEVFAVHLYPELLRSLYSDELPAIIEKGKAIRSSQVVAPQDTIARFIESLEFYFQNPTLVNDDLLGLKVKELILLLIQTKYVNSVLELISDLYSPRKVQLKMVIDLHVFSNLSIEDLAKLSNLSLSSFKREFRKEFDDSPQHYIVSRRLEKAKDLLRSTDLSIREVAFDCGFNDPLYFTRAFKKNMGVSPSYFRSENEA